MCYDAYAAIGMVAIGMSAVKGVPTATKVALWRDALAAAQRLLVTVKEKKC